MKQKIGYILVETTVRKTIRDIQENPERSIRNLVDMALTFAEGRFQQQLFETVGSLLSRQDSAYYTLVKDVVNSVHTDRLVTFGMNLGYNGCTWGAGTIRSIEAAEGFNIPWCLSLEIDPDSFAGHLAAYKALIYRGQDLGIYTWQLHTPSVPPQLMTLITSCPDSAFVLFCPPHAITDDLLTRGEACPNLMFVCEYESSSHQECGEACKALRAGGFLYGLHLIYQAGDEARIGKEDFLAKLTGLHPVFVFLSPDELLTTEERRRVYSLINELRFCQNYPLLFLELFWDNQAIDSIISQEGCSGGFRANGSLYTLSKKSVLPDTNCFNQDLKAILKRAFPKEKKEDPI